MHIYLRTETKPNERRTPLTPKDAIKLIQAGFVVSVESSQDRIFQDSEYAKAGCVIKDPGSWINAPCDVYILGLKELDEASFPLIHRHIYFAHAYKEQKGWQELLLRFQKGDGVLYDLEYLTDDAGRRVCAFGYWAGFVGSALAIQAWCAQKTQNTPLSGPLHSFEHKEVLLHELRTTLEQNQERPRVMVMGALGRSGQGACDVAKGLGLKTIEWDLEQTKKGGPFLEILSNDIFVNCVLVQKQIPPFLTKDMLGQARILTVISDVSCDPTSAINPLPLYDHITTMLEPTLRLVDGSRPLDLIAIDHLPSLLPKESSEDFSSQLLPHLLELKKSSSVWTKAEKIFEDRRSDASGASTEN